ncbi:3-deoxy-D-manno-octulosonic acid transferase [Humisphaera borealis]|uniref:3-deoxy-D-manno-octulosonic acid transferase n=1 Tax=Humisphaera borealis TaxID=2807512 RepID=A0A7M2WVG2_9BACT|nr:3-deoxy-D-manno-octulosonic acid transferase [Humisphaera borealis]QOV89413.1 3-deoxy-D-manno-octulosonic acid transferase [Humisphaera borealis]
MPNIYDIAWKTLLLLAAPAIAFMPRFRRKAARAFRERMGHDVPFAPADAPPCVMVHAVSLGEINATRALVDQLKAARPDLRFLVTVTTDTGFARGKEMYGGRGDVTVVRYPLDLSAGIRRLLDRQRPGVVVLMELEVWPNFTWHCRQRGIPVVLVNGRLTDSSFKQYRWLGPVGRAMFGRLAEVCVQDIVYRDRFRTLGVKPEAIEVTGTMKFDNAQVADRIAGDRELAAEVGLHPGREPIWVCGSTGPGEERIVLDAYRTLLTTQPMLRLVIVPRHPERFDAVARLIAECGFDVFRRSHSRQVAPAAMTSRPLPTAASPSAVVLGDTVGELRKFYSIADVVFVGRTLVDLGQRQRGSDMIEPAALAKPVIVGKWTDNFADAMRHLKRAEGIIEIEAGVDLARAVSRVLNYPSESRDLGEHAREVVKSQQGSTARHVEVILRQLATRT